MRYLAICGGLAWMLLTASVALGAEPADLIYHNGIILTIDDDRPTAEAVAVKDGRILAVGTEADVLETAGDGTYSWLHAVDSLIPSGEYPVGISAGDASNIIASDTTISVIATLASPSV